MPPGRRQLPKPEPTTSPWRQPHAERQVGRTVDMDEIGRDDRGRRVPQVAPALLAQWVLLGGECSSHYGRRKCKPLKAEGQPLSYSRRQERVRSQDAQRIEDRFDRTLQLQLTLSELAGQPRPFERSDAVFAGDRATQVQGRADHAVGGRRGRRPGAPLPRAAWERRARREGCRPRRGPRSRPRRRTGRRSLPWRQSSPPAATGEPPRPHRSATCPSCCLGRTCAVRPSGRLPRPRAAGRSRRQRPPRTPIRPSPPPPVTIGLKQQHGPPARGQVRAAVLVDAAQRGRIEQFDG